MKIKAKVIGIGERKSGVSKKGKEYDFTPFHLVYQDKNTQGAAVVCTNIAQSLMDETFVPELDDEITIFCHFFNGAMSVDGIL